MLLCSATWTDIVFRYFFLMKLLRLFIESKKKLKKTEYPGEKDSKT